MLRRLWLLIVIPFLIFSGCKKEEGKVLARVGKTTFTVEEFYSMIPPQYIGTLTPVQRQELLKNWINAELLYQEALKEKIHKEPAIKFRLHAMEREIVANEFLERYISKIGSIDESEIKSYFAQHQDEYNTERQVAQIVVRDESQAHGILKKLKDGNEFSKLASQYSIDPSSKNGGLMGYMRRGDMPNMMEFEDGVYSLKEVGDISEPIRTVYGYHIIKLLGVKKVSKKVEYEDVKEDIRNSLTIAKQKKTVIDLLDKLRKEKAVEENDSLLE